MNGTDKVFQTSLKRQRARQRLREFAEIQSNDLFSSDNDTLELSTTASSSSQTTDYNEAGTSFRSEYVVLNAPKNFIDNKEFTRVLDRLKLNDNVATILAATFIKSCQENVEIFSFSQSTNSGAARIFSRGRPKFFKQHSPGAMANPSKSSRKRDIKASFRQETRGMCGF